MKFSAVILLVIFAVFTSEKMILPSGCMNNQKDSNCRMCCKIKKEKGLCGKMKNKPSEKGNSVPQCVDCPLCAVMSFQPIHDFRIHIPVVKQDHNLFQPEKLAAYCHQQWKPPDISSFSQVI